MSNAALEYARIAELDLEPDFEPELIRDLGDGTYIMAKRLLFHWTLIRGYLDDYFGYDDRWCYVDRDLAIQAFKAFPDSPPAGYEPDGWHRHPKSGRRREGADPATEYIDP